MDILLVLGFILAVGLVGFGMTSDQETMRLVFTSLEAFADIPSTAIAVGGTIGAMMISSPVGVFKKIGSHLKIIVGPYQFDSAQSMAQTMGLATETRMKGPSSLEDKLSEISEPFLHNSLTLVVDSVDSEKAREAMETELKQLSEHHALDHHSYEKAVSYAPVFGMIGTLVGLVLVLGDVANVDVFARGMAVVLVITLYGSLLVNAMHLPMASKLKTRCDEEFLCKQPVIEGILTIQEGENFEFIEERLFKLLPADYKRSGGNKEEKDKTEKKKVVRKKRRGNTKETEE